MDEFGPDVPEDSRCEFWGNVVSEDFSYRSPPQIGESNPHFDAWRHLRVIDVTGVSYGDVLWYADWLRHSVVVGRADDDFVPNWWHREAILHVRRWGSLAHDVIVAAMRVEQARRERG